MTQTNIYTVGGTVQAGNGVYIPRKADRQLLALCQERTFSYVLSPRQLGKSSLMVQTAETLRQSGVRTAIIDLQPIGVQLSAEEWYLGLLTELEDQFDLDVDLLDWWDDHEHLGLSQRMTRFFSEVILTEIEEPIVVFVDEIDTTLSLDFTDDFFIAIRYFYTARAQNPAFNRLSFVLIGVATPADLIRNPQRTPFNVGERVDVTDFTLEEAMPLAAGFGISDHRAERLLERILDWTGGHPYLTQRLCQAVTESKRAGTELSEADIDRVVATTFFGSMSDRDNNLQFVRDMLTQRAPDLYSTLTIYKDIWREKVLIEDEEQSLIKSHLKLSGVVKRDADKTLHVRNAIYQQVFNEAWIRDNLPINWRKRVRQLQGAVAAGLLLMTAMSGLTYWAFSERQRAEAALARVGEERDRAEAEAAKARKSSAEAFLQRQEAEAQREEAEEQREEANKQQTLAEKRRQEAEEGRRAEEEAKKQALLAEQQAEEGQQIAEAARRRALQSQQAEAEQRQIAELQTVEARSTLSLLTDNVNQISELFDDERTIGLVGFSHLRRDISNLFLPIHQYIIEKSGQTLDLQQSAETRLRLALSSDKLGDSAKAADEYRLAFLEAKEAANLAQSADDFPLSLRKLLNETTYLYAWNQMNYGLLEEAEETLNVAKSFTETYDDFDDPELIESFASLENAFARLFGEKNQLERELEHHKRAVQLARDAVAADQDNDVLLLRSLAIYLQNLSITDESLMPKEEAKKYDRESCELARTIDNYPEAGIALLPIISECVRSESLVGEASDKIERLEKIRERLKFVLKLDPSDIGLQLSLARIESRLLNVAIFELEEEASKEASRKYFEDVLSTWLSVVGEGNTLPLSVWKLRAVYIDMRNYLTGSEEIPDSEQTIEKIAEIIEKSNLSFEGSSELSLIAADSRLRLGELQMEANPTAAIANFTKSIDFFTKAGTLQNTTSYTEHFDWACKAYSKRLKLNIDREEIELVLSDLEIINDLCLSAYEKYPFDYYLHSSILSPNINTGELLYEKGRFEEAKPLLEYGSYWGSKSSTELLASMYEKGLGVDVDISRARELYALAPLQSIKRFTVPANFGDSGTAPFHFYVYQKPADYPYRGIDGQILWLKKARGGTVAEDVAESFRKLQQIAEENNVSFAELAAYALGNAAQQAEQNSQGSEE